MSTPIHPVLLCGGSGTRLWPLSRESYPKQFAKVLETESLFQSAVRRLSGDRFTAPVVVTSEPYRFIVSEQLAQIESAAQAILLEPEGKNTAPAILLAALKLSESDPDALMLVAPSDHLISDLETFQNAVYQGASKAEEGRLVTFGVEPDRPETGYGYLEVDSSLEIKSKLSMALVRFVEKPDFETAEKMIASGNFLWNSGIFLFSAKSIILAFTEHQPKMLEFVREAFQNSIDDLGFTRINPEIWTNVESISIDYAVMEKSQNLQVVPFDGGWSDLGDWASVLNNSKSDSHGNGFSGNITQINCEGTLLRSETDSLQVVGIGLKDTIVVAMGDAVLVADKSLSQSVSTAVKLLRSKNVSQATQLPRDYRPWGWYESLVIGARFQVKRIVVNPNESLSLQSHHHRSEHWIVVEGTAKVTIDSTVKLLAENESVYIPLGAVHRLENPGKFPMVLIEIQTGSYLGEDDIIRYEDVYSRG